MVGAWTITKDAKEYQACGLPEKVASAFTKATMNLIGAKYKPLMYLSTQVVKGMNHMILCRQTLLDADATERIVTLVLNISPEGDADVVTITPLF